MRVYALIAVTVLAATTVGLVFSGQKRGHQFTDDQCTTCHIGQGKLRGEAGKLKPDITGACATCHLGALGHASHPTDIEPKMHLPPDMILVDGKMTCVTCHVMHRVDGGKKGEDRYYLRRSVSGKQFCLICHSVDEKGHLFVGATHSSKLRVKDISARVDSTTLLCVECHTDHISSIDRSGSGTMQHSTGRLNHPVGVEYEQVASRKPRLFTPRTMLREEIELSDGRIGCGTCHNRFSRHRYMLVMSNEGSALCFSCHNL